MAPLMDADARVPPVVSSSVKVLPMGCGAMEGVAVEVCVSAKGGAHASRRRRSSWRMVRSFVL